MYLNEHFAPESPNLHVHTGALVRKRHGRNLLQMRRFTCTVNDSLCKRRLKRIPLPGITRLVSPSPCSESVIYQRWRPSLYPKLFMAMHTFTCLKFTSIAYEHDWRNTLTAVVWTAPFVFTCGIRQVGTRFTRWRICFALTWWLTCKSFHLTRQVD